MPSGRTHDSITLWCLPPLAAIGWWLTEDGTVMLLFCGCFLFSGLMFGPDLDIYSRQYQRWGVLRWVWLPYRRSMSHRSVLSHGPVIGTLLRVAYVVTLLLTIAIAGYGFWAIGEQIRGTVSDWLELFRPWFDGLVAGTAASIQQHPRRWIGSFLGLELGAMSHSLSDTIGSAIKRRQRKRNKAR
jgi:uncharacterized metal-binding protein